MKIVVALGGNALGRNLKEQMQAVRKTAQAIADLAEDGHEVAVTHGNGPQVGLIQNAFAAYRQVEPASDVMPLSMCVAMSQGYIGYDLQNTLGEELDRRGIKAHVATVLTQVTVDPEDPAFAEPSKPIGPFMTQAQAEAFRTRTGAAIMEDAGRGWRQAVASPQPQEIIEIHTIRALLASGHVVVAAGGGGIPVVWDDGVRLCGVPAVIDKDFASACLAEQLGADCLIILTAVERVALHFGKPTERPLDTISVGEARRYIDEGHFAPGSMRPKMEAATRFAASASGRTALITLLEKARDGIAGKTGTKIRHS